MQHEPSLSDEQKFTQSMRLLDHSLSLELQSKEHAFNESRQRTDIGIAIGTELLRGVVNWGLARQQANIQHERERLIEQKEQHIQEIQRQRQIAQENFDRATKLHNQGKYKEAADTFQKANDAWIIGCQNREDSQEQKIHIDVYYNWALALNNFGDISSAIEKLEKILSAYPNTIDTDVLNLLGKLYAKLVEKKSGREKIEAEGKAIDKFRQSLDINRNQNDIRARLAFLSNDFPEVIESVHAASQEGIRDHELYTLQTIANIRLKQFDEAVTSVCNAIPLIPRTQHSARPILLKLYKLAAEAFKGLLHSGQEKADGFLILSSWLQEINSQLFRKAMPAKREALEEEQKSGYGEKVSIKKERKEEEHKNIDTNEQLEEIIISCYREITSIDPYDIEALTYLAEHQDIAAMNNLGKCYMEGFRVDVRDYTQAYRLLSQAAGGHKDAKARLAMLHVYGAGGAEKDYRKAHQLLDEACAQDSGKAWCNKGAMYVSGWGVGRDMRQAFTCFQRSADLGCCEGVVNLARCYFLGEGVEQDYIQARILSEKILHGYEENFPSHAFYGAKFILGKINLKGWSVPIDIISAKKYFKELEVEQDKKLIAPAEIISEVGTSYYNEENLGPAVERYTKAFKLWEYALAMGNVSGETQFNLGLCHYYGRGTAQNYKKAIAYFREAAAKYALANLYLSKMYYHGQGAPSDYGQAMHCCELTPHAPASTATESMFYSNLMCYFGRGRPAQRSEELARTIKEFPYRNLHLKPVIATNKHFMVEVHEAHDNYSLFYRVARFPDNFTADELRRLPGAVKGINPSVIIDNNNYIFVMYEDSSHTYLFSVCGRLQEDLTIVWSQPRQYDTGQDPSVAIATVNQTQYIFEAHQSENFKEIYSRIGHIDAENSIFWYKSKLHCCGVTPSIATYHKNNIIYVVECHKSESEAKVFYSVGVVDNISHSILWESSGKKILEHAINPAVTIDKDGTVFLVAECVSKKELVVIKGKLNENQTIKWENTISYDVGEHPTIVAISQEEKREEKEERKDEVHATVIEAHEFDSQVCTVQLI